MSEPDQVRWFDALGRCVCGSSATGILRGPRNESYGVYCKRCAAKRLHKATKERAAAIVTKATGDA
jgi:hypothetical protein